MIPTQVIVGTHGVEVQRVMAQRMFPVLQCVIPEHLPIEVVHQRMAELDEIFTAMHRMVCVACLQARGPVQ